MTNKEQETYMECSPTGASDETIETYELPITDKSVNNKSQNEIINLFINFFIFIFIIIISIFIVPFMYKTVVIKFIDTIITEGNDKKAGNLKTTDIIINLILFGICFALIGNGNAVDNRTEIIIGVYGIIFVLIINVIMYLNKLFNEKDYNFSVKSSSFNFTVLNYLKTFFIDNWKDILKLSVVLDFIIFPILIGLYYGLDNMIFNPFLNYDIILNVVFLLAFIITFIYSHPSGFT